MCVFRLQAVPDPGGVVPYPVVLTASVAPAVWRCVSLLCTLAQTANPSHGRGVSGDGNRGG